MKTKFSGVVAFFLACAFFTINVAAQKADTAVYTYGNGRPGCRTEVEFGHKWRNNWDPIRYWQCTADGAVSYICPDEHIYLDSRECCVHWSCWTWTPPFDPPTLA